MRLLCCHVENFGKLRDRSFSFEQGLGVICEENGWGKSTLAAFLRAMFYGFEGERKRGVTENERKRFQPWQGGVYGGSLSFEAAGRRYVATRRFADREAGDFFELRELETNLISRDYSSRLGEELFGIDRASFVRTVFIGQGEAETETTDDINSRVGRITDSSNDMNHYERAYQALTDILNHLAPGKKTGSLYKRREEIASLEKQVRDGENLESVLSEYTRRIREEKEALEECMACRDALREQCSRAAALQSREVLRTRWTVLRERVDSLEERERLIRGKMPGEIPAFGEINSCIVLCGDLDRARTLMEISELNDGQQADLAAGRELFRDGIPSKEEFEEVLQKIHRLAQLHRELDKEQRSRRQQSRRGWLRLLFGLLALAAGLALILWGPGEGLFLPAALGALAGIGGMALGLRGWRMILGKKPSPKEEGSEAEEEIRAFLQRYGWDAAQDAGESYAETVYHLKNKAEAYSSALERERNYRRGMESSRSILLKLDRFFQSYGIPREQDLWQQLGRIRDLADDLEQIRGQLETAREELRAFEEQEDVKPLFQASAKEDLPPLEELSLREQELSDRMDKIREKIRDYENAMLGIREKYEVWEQAREKLEELRSLQAAEETRYREIEKARFYLEVAKNSMTSRYITPLLSSFHDYYERITQGSADGFHMDANLAVTVDEQGGQRPVELFSRGYRDLAGICLRVSLIDAMYRQEKPVLFLDDPFTNLDDFRTARAMKLLETIAEKYQILYFTCSNSRTGR